MEPKDLETGLSAYLLITLMATVAFLIYRIITKKDK